MLKFIPNLITAINSRRCDAISKCSRYQFTIMNKSHMPITGVIYNLTVAVSYTACGFVKSEVGALSWSFEYSVCLLAVSVWLGLDSCTVSAYTPMP